MMMLEVLTARVCCGVGGGVFFVAVLCLKSETVCLLLCLVQKNHSCIHDKQIICVFCITRTVLNRSCHFGCPKFYTKRKKIIQGCILSKSSMFTSGILEPAIFFEVWRVERDSLRMLPLCWVRGSWEASSDATLTHRPLTHGSQNRRKGWGQTKGKSWREGKGKGQGALKKKKEHFFGRFSFPSDSEYCMNIS